MRDRVREDVTVTLRLTHHASRITRHASRVTHHVSRITHHASRITCHASRVTHHVSRVTHHVTRPELLSCYPRRGSGRFSKRLSGRGGRASFSIASFRLTVAGAAIGPRADYTRR